MRNLLLIILGLSCLASSLSGADVRPGDVLWANALDNAADLAAGTGAGRLAASPQRTALEITQATAQGSTLRSFDIPIETLRGRWIYLSGDVKGQDISARPADWNGVKLMLRIDTPAGVQWPQAAIPVGAFEWRRFSTRIRVPADASAAKLILGLEKVSGTVWFDNLRATLAKVSREVPAAPAERPIFKGHSLPRLRGAMVHPRMTREDLRTLSQDWGGNLIRWQLLHLPTPGTENDLAVYDRWLEGELGYLDQVLAWAKELGVMVVVDLHSPPGGPIGGGGTANAGGAFWTNPAAQAHFVDVWKRIAGRYKGQQTIWGFDLLNEPHDEAVVENCDDWQALAARAALAVRQVDPQRTLIVEPPDWGGAAGFVGFEPLDLPGVVYSFHMYTPMDFTHQGVIGHAGPFAYPGRIDQKAWDRAALEESMAPAISFANKYRVHLYVGEFSAARWAPGADRYLADLTSIFESRGWDWSYHAFREWQGWNLELGPEAASRQPTTAPAPGKRAILHWMQQNHPAR